MSLQQRSYVAYLRTVASLLARTPPNLLKEILLVDDTSGRQPQWQRFQPGGGTDRKTQQFGKKSENEKITKTSKKIDENQQKH